MKKSLLRTIAMVCLGIVCLPKVRAEGNYVGPIPASPTHEFQGDDLPTVLRLLAKEAKTTVIIDDGVAGKVTMRLEDKTPLEAIKIIARSKGLTIDEKDGVTYIGPDPSKPAPITPPVIGTISNSGTSDSNLADLLTPAFAGGMTKIYDLALDYQARPETAKKLAKAKRRFYEALIAEGFTKDEAFRIILTNQSIEAPGASK